MARPHPYHFAFHMLPQLVWRRPEAVRHELGDPLLARELLLYVWDKAAENLASPERVASRGLQLSWHRVAGRATALLQLPAAQATGEAHLAAIVYEQPEADPATHERVPDDLADDTEEPLPDEPDELLPRYFLLEATLGRSPDEAGTPTMLGELRGEHHRHHAPGPPAGRADTAGRFLQALAGLLGPPPEAVPIMRIVRQ
ncbi:MAG: hypothetical protein ACRYFK_16940 [Janthinobacterium lividum]